MLASQQREAMMLVEALGRFVLRINDDGEDAKLGACGAHNRIAQKGGTKPLSVIAHGYGQTAEESRGYYWVAWEPLGNLRRKLVDRDAGSGQGVVSSYFVRIDAQGYKTRGDTTLGVLGSLFAQVAVEWLRSALETRAVVGGRERLDAESGFQS